MEVQIELAPSPIDRHAAWPPEPASQTGARAEFQGIVRGEEDGRAITALEYEAYSPMARQVMRQIVEEIGTQHPCQFVRVQHRVGVVPVGEAAIHVVATAAHRAEAFAMLAGFMDRLKQDVPIWKRRALAAAGPVAGPPR